nr:uncharacterized protein LOC109193049 [Ipomoea batatas]
MSPASRSKSKDKKAGNGKEPPKASSKTSSHANVSAGVATSGYNPILGTFHALDPAPVTAAAAAPIHVNGRFKNMDETDDQNSNSFGTGVEYDSVSNNGSWSGESEDHKVSHPAPKQEIVPGADGDKREKIRQKNERKHQRQKERRAQELHEKCSGYLMSRKLEALAQQLVAMGFSQERATMALIQNEGKVEESVAWLFEGGEEADEHKEHDIDGGGNLKIDISEELNRISDMENRYKYSKQEVERVVVACEGDIEKAEESLRTQKQETTSVPSKTEETGDPPTVGSGKVPNTASQNSISAAVKHTSPAAIQQKRDDKDFNYTKITATANSSIDPASKSIQSLKRVQPKMEWAKPPQVIVSSDKSWQGALSNPSAYSFTSSQASPSPAKTEAQYVAVENELKNLQLGSIREPVIVMQRPQSINAKQFPPSTMSSSPPGTAGGWYPNGVETVKPTGMVPHVPGVRNLSPNTNQLYNQLHYQQQQQQQQYVSTNGGSHESPGTSRGNGMWSRTSTSQPLTLAAASSLGLFSGLGTNGPSGSSSPVDWNSGFSMPQLDYNNIDWSLDRRSSSPISGGLWPTMNSLMQNNHHTFNSFTNGLGNRVAMKPTLSSGDGISIPRLQDGIAPVESSAGGSREWTSPFEEKDLFSLPRQFVSSPTL